MAGDPQPKTYREPRSAKRLKAKPSKRARPGEPMADRCDICGDPFPSQRHHKLRRSQGGSDDRTNTMDLCGADHARIHANPEWAYANGYLTRRSS